MPFPCSAHLQHADSYFQLFRMPGRLHRTKGVVSLALLISNVSCRMSLATHEGMFASLAEEPLAAAEHPS